MSRFDAEIDRTGTFTVKYDGRAEKFGRTDVIPLWVADMDFAAPAAVTKALTARATHPIYGYTLYPDSLYASLINWLKQRHGWTIEREWILFSPGVVPSLATAIQALSVPGDGVIVQPPVYYPFFTVVTKTGRKLLDNPLLLRDEQYHIDFDHLAELAASARLLLLCSPHNPVGRVWQQAELEKLLDLAKQYQLTVISDEIHADLLYPSNTHCMLGKLIGTASSVITAVAPSKTFNIPGLNLSALIIPDAENRNAIRTQLDMMHVSAANPFSIAAFEAAYRDGKDWLDELTIYLAETRDMVQEYLHKHLPKIRLIPAEGTYLLWLDCRQLGMDDKTLQQFFIEEARVGMNPGIAYGKAGSGFMRMNIGTPRNQIKQALDNIRAGLNRRA